MANERSSWPKNHNHCLNPRTRRQFCRFLARLEQRKLPFHPQAFIKLLGSASRTSNRHKAMSGDTSKQVASKSRLIVLSDKKMASKLRLFVLGDKTKTWQGSYFSQSFSVRTEKIRLPWCDGSFNSICWQNFLLAKPNVYPGADSEFVWGERTIGRCDP